MYDFCTERRSCRNEEFNDSLISRQEASSTGASDNIARARERLEEGGGMSPSPAVLGEGITTGGLCTGVGAGCTGRVTIDSTPRWEKVNVVMEAEETKDELIFDGRDKLD